MKNLSKKIIRIAWKTYGFLYFRGMMIGHYIKGDITVRALLIIMLPPAWRPKSFDYFKGLRHPPAKLPGTL